MTNPAAVTTPAPLTTVTFADSWNGWLKRLDLGLTDRSVEVGLYSRVAFAGTLAQWDAVHAAMADLRSTQRGSAKGGTTAAMGRIWTTEKRDAHNAKRDEARARRAARRAARS